MPKGMKGAYGHKASMSYKSSGSKQVRRDRGGMGPGTNATGGNRSHDRSKGRSPQASGKKSY